MVSRDDLRKFNAATNDIQAALADMRELHENDQIDGVTVDAQAYAEAQQQLKDALAKLVNDGNAAVDTTDEFTAEDGTTVSLPEAALAREQNAELPSSPSN